MRSLAKGLTVVALVLLTSSVVDALQFETSSTNAYATAAVVTSVLDQAVWRIRNQACTTGEQAIDPDCGEVVTAYYSDDLQSMHWFEEEECLDEVKGFHDAIPEQGLGISASSTDWCP